MKEYAFVHLYIIGLHNYADTYINATFTPLLTAIDTPSYYLLESRCAKFFS